MYGNFEQKPDEDKDYGQRDSSQDGKPEHTDPVDIDLVVAIDLAQDSSAQHNDRKDYQIAVHVLKAELVDDQVGQTELENGKYEDCKIKLYLLEKTGLFQHD